MRFVLILAISVFLVAPRACARGPAPVPDTQQLSKMAADAAQSKPKDRCYLYAKLVSALSRVVGRDVRNGDTADTSSSLRAIRSYTSVISRNVSKKSKRLRNAQIILQHTAFHLKEMMMNASLSQQADFQSTLTQVNQAQSQMMLTVFQK